MMPSPMTMTVASEDSPGGLLIRDGDIVGAVGEDIFFVYKQSDGASLELSEDDGRLILSGQNRIDRTGG